MNAVIRCYRTESGAPDAIVAPGMQDLRCLLGELGRHPGATDQVMARIAAVERGERDHVSAWYGDGYWANITSNTTVSIGLCVPGPITPTLRLSFADFKDAMVKWKAVCADVDDDSAGTDQVPSGAPSSQDPTGK